MWTGRSSPAFMSAKTVVRPRRRILAASSGVNRRASLAGPSRRCRGSAGAARLRSRGDSDVGWAVMPLEGARKARFVTGEEERIVRIAIRRGPGGTARVGRHTPVPFRAAGRRGLRMVESEAGVTSRLVRVTPPHASTSPLTGRVRPWTWIEQGLRPGLSARQAADEGPSVVRAVYGVERGTEGEQVPVVDPAVLELPGQVGEQTGPVLPSGRNRRGDLDTPLDDPDGGQT